ncbi:MAG TPA: hypothetical protein VFS09_00655 [Candidatus Eisenbacteria bacterium]|nr:hypothetical protein [Candidatus Eisenbacteria bacterium]
MTRTGLGLTILLTALFVAPRGALASSPKAPPDSVGRSLGGWTDTEDWKLFLGRSYCDTLDAQGIDVILAAGAALERKKWVISTSDEEGYAYVTEWKPIRNFFFRLVAGKAVARCFASVTRLADGRTELTFRGGIASRRDLTHSSMRGRAERSYESAVVNWQKEVRAAIAHAGPVATAATLDPLPGKP